MDTIKAPEGKYLTQSSEETTDAQRVYCTEVSLAVNASPSDWREATAEEKEEFEAAQLAAMEAQTASGFPAVEDGE